MTLANATQPGRWERRSHCHMQGIGTWPDYLEGGAQRARRYRTVHLRNRPHALGTFRSHHSDTQCSRDHRIPCSTQTQEREHALWHRSYSVLAFSSLSRLAAMDSSTELVPLIHAPPSHRRSSGKGP